MFKEVAVLRGSIHKKGEKYYPILYLGKDSLGKKKYKWLSGYKKEKDAEKALRKALKDYDDGLYLNVNDMTVEELCEQYFEIYIKTLSYRTEERYKSIINNSIIPMLGKAKIDEIKTIHIQRYLHTLNDKAPATVKKHYYVLKKMFEQAVKWNLININPCEGVVLPKEKRTEMKVWDKETINEFLKIVKGTKWYIPFLIAFTSGLRQGEIAGLKWQDFNKEENTLYVVRTMQRNFELKATKTKSSMRKIVLMDSTIEALKWQLKWQEENKKTFDEYKDTGFICTHENGKPINPENMGKAFNKLVKSNNLPSIRFHDIRHTFATLLLKNGTNPKIVSEILGHSNVQTTLNVYSHMLPDMQKETMERLQESLFDI